MITAHHKKHLTLWDGEQEHRIAHDDFAPMRVGGIHPAVTEDHETYLQLPADVNLMGCPVTPITLTHAHPQFPGKSLVAIYLPIVVYLQARYGPDNQIVTVPINGDSNAQHLHWLHRNEAGQKEMRAVLEWMGAWRLKDDGSPATDEELAEMRAAKHRAMIDAAQAQEGID